MVIWNGYGILAVLYPLVLGAIGAALGGNMRGDGSALLLGGIGVLIGAALAFVHGWYMNVSNPKKKFEEWQQQERPRMQEAAARGQFSYNGISPRSPQETDELISRLFADRQEEALRQLHRVFFVPMQWFSVAAAVLGLVLIVMGISR